MYRSIMLFFCGALTGLDAVNAVPVSLQPTQTNRASPTATAPAQASTVATSTAATAAAAAASAATPVAAATTSAPRHSASQAPPATAATVAASPAAHMNAHALPAAPLASSSFPSAAAARPFSATAAAPTAAVAAAATTTTAAARSNPSAASSLQSAFEHVYREVHKHVSADEGGGAVGSAPPLSAAALLDTFSCLMAHHQSLHQQLDASHLTQAHLQARVSASQRELLSFQPFLQSHVVASHAQKHAHLRSAFMDPAIDALLASAHAQRIDLQTKLNEKQERSVADTFSTDSLTGRRLLARTKRLMEENVQFGVLLNESAHNDSHAGAERAPPALHVDWRSRSQPCVWLCVCVRVCSSLQQSRCRRRRRHDQRSAVGVGDAAHDQHRTE